MSFGLAVSFIVLAAILGAALMAWMSSRRERTLETVLAAAQEELKRQQDNQAQAIHTTKLAALGQMVAGVAHEINTPLGFVKSNVEVVNELLRDYEASVSRLISGIDVIATGGAPALEQARPVLAKARRELTSQNALSDAKDLLRDCLDGLKTIAELVLNLKGFSRVDREGTDLADLNESLKNALTVVSHQLRDKIKVVQQLEPALPRVRCVPAQLNQVFLNLINNAAQSMDDRGTLSITSRSVSNGAVEIAVSDTGCGIPDKVLPRIFDPFFTTKKVGEGTGLGLSIVHKIVRAHGGSIHVKTKVGEGTTFTVTLPVDFTQPSVKAA
jgi:signal transduction histidine kinase